MGIELRTHRHDRPERSTVTTQPDPRVLPELPQWLIDTSDFFSATVARPGQNLLGLTATAYLAGFHDGRADSAIRTAAVALMTRAENMRIEWAESDPDVRNRDLWQPLHEAADNLREALERDGAAR